MPPKLAHPQANGCKLVLLLACALLAGCVYRVDVQQGNLLEATDIEAVKPGMTRSQVRFLLGTPVVQDSFDKDRWDYIYYFKKGRARRADRRWLIVYFEGDLVKEIKRDVPIETG
ncbi:MAG: outer membrane protein assembly factor BamE [Gammaproteobacteria bacterium]|nr:outer membrane protein assembly factor BamE [Gammaproteobacteria bacterium]